MAFYFDLRIVYFLQVERDIVIIQLFFYITLYLINILIYIFEFIYNGI